jgi:hypothetical protein
VTGHLPLRWAGAVLALGALVACSADQEPELVPDGGSTSITTSRALGPCPPGGPDATTPPAGCLDEDGTVQRP